jgi:predicted anti-sigma-YlaC factor YlaD
VKVCKSQCSVFKNLYAAYVRGEAEKETMEWMSEHQKECSYCSKWAMDKEEKVSMFPKDDEAEENYDEAKKIIRSARVFMCISMGVIIFVTMWMSIWLGI